MENKAFPVARTATEALKQLWRKGFFRGWRKKAAIEAHLGKEGNHFSNAELGMALKRARHLTRRGNRGSYQYIQKGAFVATQAGPDHLATLPKLKVSATSGELKKAGQLLVLNRGATHDFDKYLRNVFGSAKTEVLIADSFVDHSVFDRVLDAIPQTVPLKLLYSKSEGNFDAKAVRFSLQYKQFQHRRYNRLHDRFLVVDDLGYVLGPSIKNGAENSPALVVQLPASEKRLLRTFFNELWDQSKPLPNGS